nr:hypothetical protein [Tanacetum cinerariifolium]
TPLKVLRLLLLGASSCPEESSKSKEALHELRASLCFPPSQSITLKLIYSQSCLKSIFTTHNIEDLFHVRDPILRIYGSCRLLKGLRLLLVKAFKSRMNSSRWGISTSI